TATSATQIEGGCTTSDWWQWAREKGRVRGGDTPDVACDSWDRWEEDVALQRELGLGAYRLSIEWARVEPRPREFDRSALARSRQVAGALVEAGIVPMITLHHFTLPTWLADRGGTEAREFAERFEAFARETALVLGDLCSMWCTINEPSVLAAQGYIVGIW